MATATKNLSEYDASLLVNTDKLKIGIVVAEWNQEITSALYQGARNTLLEEGVLEENIITYEVPGSFELPHGAKRLIEKHAPDAVITIGSVIQGETKHFDFVCSATAQGVMELNVTTDTPVIFCVLTDNTIEQSRARSGGIHGNKGIEAAVAAIRMANL